MKKRIYLLVSAAMMLLVLTATTGCKEIMSSFDNPVSAYLEVKADSIVAYYGEPVSLKASTISTEPITYKSSDETIATVDEKGYVTAHKCGDVIITVSVAANEYYLGGTKQVKVISRSPETKIPLTIEAINAGYIYVYNPNNLTMKYSLNGADKVSFTGWQSIAVSAGDKVEFFGNNEGYCDVDNTWNGVHIYPSDEAYLYGNIMSLVSEGNYQNCTAITKDYAFCDMFTWSAANLKNHPTKEIVLPATKLTVGCYQRMFSNCTGLTAAPALPATKLAVSCYTSMFYNCDALTKAPELPAKELAAECYRWMFEDCDGLTAAPELPATKLAEGCYTSMFYNCDAMTEAPELPAKELAASCYSWMFENCDGLTATPELPATKLASSCYYGMFANCDKLTTASDLPATKLAEGCYISMFYNCDALTKAPELPAKQLAASCYSWMFEDCDGLTATPELPATKLASYCYNGMFYGCDKLTTASDLPATELTPSCYAYMFQSCSELTATPKIYATKLDTQSCLQTFTWSPKIKDAYVKFAYSWDNSSFMFYTDGDGVAEAVLHTTADSKDSWESYFTSVGLNNWTVKADY